MKGIFRIFRTFKKHFLCALGTTLAISLISLPGSAAANNAAGFFNLCLVPYVGVDGGYRRIKYEGGGDKLFKTILPQAALYGGLKFNEYIGIEGGYKSTILKSQFVRLSGGDLVLNVPVVDTPADFLARARLKGWYGALMGYIPVSSCYPISLLASIGATRLKTYHFETLLRDALGTPAFFTQFNTFRSKNTVLTLGIGTQYIHCDAVGIRFKIDWENTRKIKNLKPLENNASLLSLSLKNSINYNLGVFIPF